MLAECDNTKPTNFSKIIPCLNILGVTAQPTACIWHVYPGDTTAKLFEMIQLAERDTTPKYFPDRIIFMSTFHDIGLDNVRNEHTCIINVQGFQAKLLVLRGAQ